jgi:hypothetical protein
VGWLVQGIQREPASGVGQGCLVVPLDAMTARQSFQHRGQLLAQLLSLEELPVVKLYTVTQAKALQEIPWIERGSLGQGFETSRADLLSRMAVGLAGMY